MSEFEKMNVKLKKLYDNYESNPIIVNKIHEYLDKHVPRALELFIERQAAQLKRKQALEKNSQIYIDKFLNNPDKQYFFIPQSNVFIFYDGENYKIINEDDIWHTLLRDISTKDNLKPWKHKIKNSVIKIIKDKSITSSIPESCTIQHIIQHLTPILFKSKSEAKYLLTLLGDNILRKNTNISHFMRIESNEFMIVLQDHIQCMLGSQCTPCSTFKFKYYKQDYKECRILNFNDAVRIKSCWEGFIKNNVLNIIAVATHYSNQFQTAENYIRLHCQNQEVIHSICYLSNTTEDILIKKFIDEWLEDSNDSGEITWNEMYYLWKSFIRTTCNFPIMPIILKNLKAKLSYNLKYEASNDAYKMIISPKLSYVKIFQKFWNENIIAGEDEFEVSELWSLYLNWIAPKNIKTNEINEEKLLFLIEHFSQAPMIGGKIVPCIKCNLWDKQEEMREILNQLKLDYNFYQNDDVQIYKLYKDYCKKILEGTTHKTVSKKYFEKYITKIIPSEYIKDNKLLKEYWTDF